MPRRVRGEVLAGVEADIAELPQRPGTAGLRATARVLAGVLDDEKAPATAKVAASKTLTDILGQLRGPVVAEGGGDAVSRGRAAQARRRGAAA